MYLLALYVFLRVGEITKTTGSNQHSLLRKHLTFVCNTQREDYLELTIPHYKHSKNVETEYLAKYGPTSTVPSESMPNVLVNSITLFNRGTVIFIYGWNPNI